MWGSLNDRLTSVRSTITKVAHDVIEQAEELAAPPPESEYAQPSHGRQPPRSTADTSGASGAASGESSSLAALKARLQAEKSRAQEKHAGPDKLRHAIIPGTRTVGDGDGLGPGLPPHGPGLTSKTSVGQPGRAGESPVSEEVAKLQAQVNQLKKEIIRTSQANDEELERLEGERTMEVGTLKAELEGVRKQLAAQRRRSADKEAAVAGAAATRSAAEAANLQQGLATAEAQVQKLEAQLTQQREVAEAAQARQQQQLASALAQAADSSGRVEALQVQLDTERSAAREESAARAAGAAESTGAAQQLTAELQRAHDSAARAEAEAAAREAELRKRLVEEVAAREAAEGQAGELSRLAGSASQQEAALRAELETLREEAAKAQEAMKLQVEMAREGKAAAEATAKAVQAALEDAERGARETVASMEAQASQEADEAAARIQMLKQQLEQLAREREHEASAGSRAKALAEQAARAELEAARERATHLEAELQQAKAAMTDALSAAEANRRVQEELTKARGDASLLRQQLAEMQLAGEAHVQELARLREEAETRQETIRMLDGEASRRQEELSNEAALSASKKRAEGAERRANTAEQALEDAQAGGQQSVASDALQGEVAEALAGRVAAEKEKEKALRMLQMLKQQIAESEMEEEEKLSWRVEAEVRLALDEYQRSEASKAAPAREEVADLVQQLEAERSLRQGLEAEASEWRAALEAKDSELANLQLALGELAYTSEARSDAGEKLRTELRAAHAEAERMQQELAAQASALAEAQAEKDNAELALSAAEKEVSASTAAQAKLQEGAMVLRRALEESTRRMNKLSSDNSSLIDRRIVVQLIVSYFERRHATEVLDVMERMLGFTAEDKARIEAARRGGGVLSRVAGVPFAVLRGITGSGSQQGQQGTQKSATEQETDLAEAWVEFLIQQAEGMGAEEQSQPETANTEPGARPQTYAPESAASSGPGLVASLDAHQSAKPNPPSLKEIVPNARNGPGPASWHAELARAEPGLQGPAPSDPHPHVQAQAWQPQALNLKGSAATELNGGTEVSVPDRQGSTGGQADGQFSSMSLESPRKPHPWLPTMPNGVGQRQ